MRAAALRLWQENTGFSAEGLCVPEAGATVLGACGCEHLVAETTRSHVSDSWHCRRRSRHPVPAQRVRWLSCVEAIRHPRMRDAECAVLREAQRLMSAAHWCQRRQDRPVRQRNRLRMGPSFARIRLKRRRKEDALRHETKCSSLAAARLRSLACMQSL